MYGVCISVARQYTEFACAVSSGIGVIGLAAEERAEMQQPFLAEHADVDIHAIERAERADRIRAILQHARRPRRLGGVKNCASGSVGGTIFVELFVVQAAAGDAFPSPTSSPGPCAGPGSRPRSSSAGC